MDPNERIREAFARLAIPVVEKKMFGGICFMVNGNMTCGIAKGDLMLRLGNDGATAALSERHVRPMDFTGRVMKSMIFVAPEGFESANDLDRWIERASAFAQSAEGSKKK